MHSYPGLIGKWMSGDLGGVGRVIGEVVGYGGSPAALASAGWLALLVGSGVVHVPVHTARIEPRSRTNPEPTSIPGPGVPR